MKNKRKAVRLIDVAEKAGVSRVTVGKVLLGSGSDHARVAESTAERIREIAKDMGYRPNRAAQQLGGKPSRLIGVIMFMHAPSVEMDRLKELERQANERDYRLTIRMLQDPGDKDEMTACLQDFESQGVDGIISLTGNECACTEEALTRFRVCLYQGCASVLGELPGIRSNIETGTRISIEHLFSKGYRRIGLVCTGTNAYDAVRRTVLNEMTGAQAGAECFEYSAATLGHILREIREDIADAVVRDFVQANALDALLTMNDYWAAMILKALLRAGMRVPEDVAVVGYCNMELSRFTEPALTTVEEHGDQVAEAYLDLFSERMAGDDARQREITSTLVERDST